MVEQELFNLKVEANAVNLEKILKKNIKAFEKKDKNAINT